MRKLAILVATGYEDVELIAPLDVFSRQGISYDLLSIENLTQVQGSNEALVKTKPISKANMINYDGIMIPGGSKGYQILNQSLITKTWIQAFAQADKVLSAICASPKLFYDLNLLTHKKFTAHPAMELTTALDQSVVKDGKIITAQSYVDAIAFATTIVEVLKQNVVQ